MYRLWKILLSNMSKPKTFRMTLVVAYLVDVSNADVQIPCNVTTQFYCTAVMSWYRQCELHQTLYHTLVIYSTTTTTTTTTVWVSHRVDRWAVSACEFSCVNRVQWRQHIYVHRWCGCKTEKLSWHQPSSFLSSVAGPRCVDVRNGILPTCRSFATTIDLVQLFPRLLSRCCRAVGFSLMHLYTV